MTAALSRLLVALGLIGAAVVALVVAPVATSTPAAPAQAADLRYFDPGNIISDAVFFDGLAMDAGAIQDFLNARGASCSGGTDGSACIKNYRLTTTDRAPDGLCAGYQGAANESAATVIAKVAASCRINPRVLLVLLQKEVGLVTTKNPTAKMYMRAAGYGCPDFANGACDPAQAGLQNQLYRSSWNYQYYAANPNRYQYKAGRNNTIQWHPNTGCGSSTVYIANQATAGLYIYTPYRPNQAALNAGYGTGDGCSSYGNRNFWNYFVDWFGSTQSPGGSAIDAKYKQLGGATGQMGAPTSPFICGLTNGGCFQMFTHGRIYWSPATGAWTQWGAIFEKWFSAGTEWGALGYPVMDVGCGLIGGGCFQHFERGSIYTSPATGTTMVLGAVRDKWASVGWENSKQLGYPTQDVVCGLVGGGCYQMFERGNIYSSPATGTHFVSDPVRQKWYTTGTEWGSLGYPVSSTACGLADGGCYQHFERGSIYSSPSTGTHQVLGVMKETWASVGWENSKQLGYPTQDVACGLVGGGCYQLFQRGNIYSSPATGTHFVSDPIRQKWYTTGTEWGTLGYPVSSTACGLTGGGCYQHFERGSIYTSPATGTHVVRGVMKDKWASVGWEFSAQLGYPVSDEVCGLRDGGCYQSFERGSIYWTKALGARLVTGPVRAHWAALGNENGFLGYPLLDTMCGLVEDGCWQSFEGGSVYWTAGTGTHAVRGQIRTAWQVTGAEWGALGYPVMGEMCGLVNGGCGQHFQRGSVFWSPATGAHPLTGAIRNAWWAQGSEFGPWGYPTSAPRDVPGGVEQRFAGGTARLTTATGAVTFG
ncbi:LGFP repeat-containing protein [Blastococcus sp. SYSU D01042]